MTSNQENVWHYCNKPFIKDEQDLDKWQGFVYKITNPQGLMYIGAKNFWYVKKLRPLKGKKNKRHFKTQTDWENYYSSADKINDDIKENGTDGYKREILILCETKGSIAYREAELQFKLGVLMDDNYLNGIIQCRINKVGVKGLKPID